MNSKHAYDMLMQDLKAQIAQASQDRDEKSAFKAETFESKADAKGDLEDTTSTRDADQKYFGDLTATCEKRMLWAVRSGLHWRCELRHSEWRLEFSTNLCWDNIVNTLAF